MVGYIKLHRKITHWEWYTDVNTKALFLHCLLMANHKDNNWRGIEVKQGTFITSLRNLSTEIGLSVSQTRTSLKKLEMTQEIAQESHTHHTLIKVLNYAEYQGLVDDEKDVNSTIAAQHMTNKSQTNRTQNSTQNSNKQELKENKNEKNDKKLKNKEEIYSVQIVDEWEMLFKQFWQAYPKKVSKAESIKWFQKNKPTQEQVDYMIYKIGLFKETKIWQDNNGQYIPHPSTWLNQKRWEDELEERKDKYSVMEDWLDGKKNIY